MKPTPKRARSRKTAGNDSVDIQQENDLESMDPEGNEILMEEVQKFEPPLDESTPLRSRKSKSTSQVNPAGKGSIGEESHGEDGTQNNRSLSVPKSIDKSIEHLQDTSTTVSSDEGGSSASQRNRRKLTIPQRRSTLPEESGKPTPSSETKQKGRKSRKQGQPKRNIVPPDSEHVADIEMQELLSKFETSGEDWEEDVTPAKKKGRSTRAKKAPPTPKIEFPCVCLKCELPFDNQADISKHMMTVHQALWTEDCPEGRTDRRALGSIIKVLKKLKCPNCDNTQRFIHAYMDHIEWCGREHETYVCELCNQTLKSKWKKVHMRDHKNKDKKLAESAEVSMVGKNGDVLSPFRKQRSAAKRAIKTLQDVQEDALQDDNSRKKSRGSDEDVVMSDHSSDETPQETSATQSAKKGAKRAGNYRGYRLSETWNVPDELDVFESVWNWHKAMWDKTVFPDLYPRKIDWTERLTQEDCEFYYPVSEESISLQFSKINIKDSEDEKTNLKKFQRTPHGGFFAGGPVRASSWCPVPPEGSQVQYATVSCHRTMEEEHSTIETFSGRGLIQIWDCGFLTIDSPFIAPEFTLGLAHDYGCVYDMCWCPAGCAKEPPAKVDHQGKELLPRLGLLALACTDGTVRIFSVPDPRVLQEVMETKERLVVKPPPIFTLISVLNEDDPSHGCCMCVDWEMTGDRSLILAGYGTGHVCIFDLNNQSTLLSVGDFTGHVEIFPFHTFIGHSLKVTSVRWCPGQSGFFSTGSRDKWFALWDIRDTSDPVVREFCTPITALCWSQVWHEPLCVQDDSFSYNNSRILSLDAASKKGDQKKVVMPGAPGCIWSIDVSNWFNTIFTGNNMGMMVGDKLDETSGSVKKKYHKKRLFFLYELVPEFSPDEEENGQKVPETPPPNQSELDKSVDNFLTPAKPKPKSSGFPYTKKGRPPAKVQPLRLKFSEVKDSCCLHFKDNPTLTIPHGVLSDERLFSSTLQDKLPQDDHQIFPLPAVYSVSCNPNAVACTWVMTGGQAGVVRFSNVSGFISDEARTILKNAGLMIPGQSDIIMPDSSS